MTCDPVAGYVQVPCIERCAFGAVKAWTAFMIATNEIASRHRVDLDTTIKTLADTGRDMNAEIQGNERGGPGRRTWSSADAHRPAQCRPNDESDGNGNRCGRMRHASGHVRNSGRRSTSAKAGLKAKTRAMKRASDFCSRHASPA